MVKYISSVLLSLFLSLSSCTYPEQKFPARLQVAEEGFFNVCWRQSSVIPNLEFPWYVSEGTMDYMTPCEAPEALIWEELPVRYMFTEDVPEEDKEAFRRAALYWNTITDINFFVETTIAWDLRVSGSGTSVQGMLDPLAFTQHFREYNILLCRIVIYPGVFDMKPEDAELVYIHELGHSFSLDHDSENRSSIMFPYYTGGGEVTLSDLYLVKDRYQQWTN